MEEALEASILHVEREGAVLPHYANDGPLPSDEIAPAGGSPGYRDRAHSRPPQGPKRRIGFLWQEAVFGYRIVYIEKHEANGRCFSWGQVAERPRLHERGAESRRY